MRWFFKPLPLPSSLNGQLVQVQGMREAKRLVDGVRRLPPLQGKPQVSNGFVVGFEPQRRVDVILDDFSMSVSCRRMKMEGLKPHPAL